MHGSTTLIKMPPICPIDGKRHADIKSKHPTWKLCPECGLDLSPVAHLVIDLTESPQQDTPPRSTSDDPRTRVYSPALTAPASDSFAEYTKVAIRERAKSVQQTKQHKQPLIAMIQLKLYIGVCQMIECGGLLVRKYTSIQELRKFNHRPFTLHDEYATHSDLLCTTLEQYNLDKDILVLDWRIISSVTLGNGPSTTEIGQKPDTLVSFRKILDTVYPGQEEKQYALCLVTDSIVEEHEEGKKGQGSTRKGRHGRVKKEEVHDSSSIELRTVKPIKRPKTEKAGKMEHDRIKVEQDSMKVEQDSIKIEDGSIKVEHGGTDLGQDKSLGSQENTVPFEMNTRRTTRKRSHTGLSLSSSSLDEEEERDI